MAREIGIGALTRLKRWDAKLLHWSFGRSRALLAGAAAVVALTAASIPHPPPFYAD